VVLAQFAALLAKPLLKGLPVKPEVKDKFKSLAKVMTGGSGEAWIAVARQQVTLPFAEASEALSQLPSRGEAMLDGKPVAWVEFDWSGECGLADCLLSDVHWRFYRNGLVSLAAELSKDGSALDMSDLLGHQIALRDKTGFLIGIWAAAFVVPKHTKKRAFQACATDDHLPLKLHFDELDAAQTGTWFRI
jgi:hypothetical protein